MWSRLTFRFVVMMQVNEAGKRANLDHLLGHGGMFANAYVVFLHPRYTPL